MHEPDPTSASAPPLTYVIPDPSTDRDRLYTQYDLFREDFNTWFDRALHLGGLSIDPATATWRVLDAGCGEGLFAAEIATRFPCAQVLGVDRDAAAISTANRAFGRFRDPQGRGDVEFYTHDLRQPLPAQFEPGLDGPRGDGLDLIFAHTVLMHMADPAGALAHLTAALKPGGVLYLRDASVAPDPCPHPGLADLFAVGVQAMQRIATDDFANRQAEYLAAAGFTTIERGQRVYAVGGPTREGQRMLQNLIASLQSARPGLVDHLHLISNTEFERHLQRVQTESTLGMVGEWALFNTVARKPSLNILPV